MAAAAIILAAAIYLGRTIAANAAQLAAFDWQVRPVRLAASVLLLTGVLAWGVWIWVRVLDRFEHPPVPFRTLFRIWFLSNLARYVPGKIWQFVGVAQLGRAAGLPGPVLLSSLVVQVGFTILAAAVVSIATLPLTDLGLGPARVAGIGAIAAASLLLVHPAVINLGLRLVPRALRTDVLRWTGSWGDGLVLLAFALVAWAAYGLAFGLFVDALVRVPPAAYWPLTGVNALSFLVGYLVFVAPAGLGAREAVMAELLSPWAPAGVAALLAVAARLWTVAAELLGAALALALHTRRQPHA